MTRNDELIETAFSEGRLASLETLNLRHVDPTVGDVRVTVLTPTSVELQAAHPFRIRTVQRFRLGAPGSPLRLEATVETCRLIRNQRDGSGEMRPVYRARLGTLRVLRDEGLELETPAPKISAHH